MTRRTVRPLLAAASLALGCASGSGAPAARTTQEHVMLDLAGAGFDVKLFRDEVLAVDTLALAPAAAWRGLVRAYASLGVPPSRRGAARRPSAARARARSRGISQLWRGSRPLRDGRPLAERGLAR
jgi:hypothetical protein